MTTPQLFELLSKKYPAPAFAFLGNVRNTTGFVRDIRTADALSLGLWPSRGMYLTGFELKVSRSDWLHEFKQPAKADEICKYCDFWYLVVSDTALVQDGELPKTWGLMAVEKGKLKIIKEAPFNKPMAMDRPFLAGFLRNVQENYFPKKDLMKFREIAVKEAEQSLKYKVDSVQSDLKELQEALDKFENSSGVKIEKWSFGNIGEAVKMVLSGKNLRVTEDLKRVRKLIDDALNGTDNY